MKNLKSNIALAAALLALAISGYQLLPGSHRSKIAYVRSSELIYGYSGMQEAHMEFEKRSAQWKSNIDTLQKDFQVALAGYTEAAPELDPARKREREKLLQSQQEHLINYSRAMDNKAKEEDEKITQGVLNQINSFVETYGKENGYDIILGTTLSGNLLYGEETIDITKEVLEALNRHYKGEGQKHGE